MAKSTDSKEQSSKVTDRARSDEDVLAAAVDLGSNSFHMVVGRRTPDGLEVVDRERERVRIAEGLSKHGEFLAEAQVRALACLESFGRRLEGLSAAHVRAVGTNAFRRADNAAKFLVRAESALGCPIDIVSGAEEARLVHLGVARSAPLPPEDRALVIDIGGGSTECIIGRAEQIEKVASLQVGCVSHSERHFPELKADAKRFRTAVVEARLKLEPVQAPFRRFGWNRAYGTAGTIHSTSKILRDLGRTDGTITKEALEGLRDEIVAHGDLSTIELPRLKTDRRPVFAGGLAVLLALFDGLSIDELVPVSGGLREGVLEDLLDRLDDDDTRGESIAAFATRHHVDREHADRVRAVALSIHDVVAEKWELRDPRWRRLLEWAATVHEVGAFVSPIGHQKHGGYLVRNCDLQGFTNDEREALAVLVRNQRKKPQVENLDAVRHLPPRVARRIASILRLAVNLCRDRLALKTESRDLTDTTQIEPKRDGLVFGFDGAWTERNPLVAADLAREIRHQKLLGIEMSIPALEA